VSSVGCVAQTQQTLIFRNDVDLPCIHATLQRGTCQYARTISLHPASQESRPSTIRLLGCCQVPKMSLSSARSEKCLLATNRNTKRSHLAGETPTCKNRSSPDEKYMAWDKCVCKIPSFVPTSKSLESTHSLLSLPIPDLELRDSALRERVGAIIEHPHPARALCALSSATDGKPGTPLG
jgi:hypothetical protein